MSQVRDLLVSSARSIFETTVTKDVIDAVESGKFPQHLWQAIEDNGLDYALVPEDQGGAGVSCADAAAILRVAGAAAAPAPLADSMIAPRIDPIQTLVYGATGRVTRATIVDGRISMRDGEVAGIDLTAARGQAQRQFDGLVAKYPDRTFQHPPVEEIFPPSYPLTHHSSEVSR